MEYEYYPRKDGWQEGFHLCECIGSAILYCYTLPDGTMYAGNTEYRSPVNFCPMCGKEAPVPANKNAPAP